MGVIRDQIDRAAADAASSAKEALSTVSSTIAEALPTGTEDTDSASPPSSRAAENLDDFLENDTDSPSTSTTKSSSAKPSPSIKPFSLSSFTEEDYTSLSSLYTSVSDWLSDTTIAHEALAAYEDSSLSVADLERKAKQLSDASNDMLRKMMKRAGGNFGGGFGGSSSSSKSKTKSSKTASSSAKFRIPTPRVSILSEGSVPAAEPSPAPGSEEVPQGHEAVAPEPEIADKVLGEEDVVDVPGVESTTEAEATPRPEEVELLVGGKRDEL